MSLGTGTEMWSSRSTWLLRHGYLSSWMFPSELSIGVPHGTPPFGGTYGASLWKRTAGEKLSCEMWLSELRGCLVSRHVLGITITWKEMSPSGGWNIGCTISLWKILLGAPSTGTRATRSA